MIIACKKVLGEPPCEYAIVAFGSMARKEMTPYSDFEWGIIIEDNISDERRDEAEKYFSKLSKYLLVKIINLGETILPSLAINELNVYVNREIDSSNFYDVITPRGFSMDGLMPSASKWPLGNEHVSGIEPKQKFKLIGTAKELAKLHNEEYYLADKHLTTVLSTTSLVHGSTKAEELTNDYKIAAREELSKPDGSDLSKTIQQTRSLKLLTEAVAQFGYNGGKFNEDGHYFDAKQLYRMPNLFIEHLSLLFSIEGNSVWEKIEALQKNKNFINNRAFFSVVGGDNLKVASSMILSCRLNAYLKRGEQKDEIISLAKDGLGEEKLKEVFEITREELFRIYYSFIILTDRLRGFLHSGNGKFYPEEEYYDNSYFIRGGIHGNFLEHDEALEYYAKEKEFGKSRNVDSLEFANTLISEGIVYIQKGNYAAAQNSFESALPIKLTKEDSPTEKAFIYANLASVSSSQGKTDQALDYYYKAFESIGGIGTKHEIVSKILLMIGNVFRDLDDNDVALKHYEDALKINREVSHPDTAQNLINIGDIFTERKEYQKAEKSYVEALTMIERRLGKFHPNIARVFNAIGDWNSAQGKHDIAQKYHNDALRIQEPLGFDHPEIAKTYNDIGVLLARESNLPEALEYYDKALRIKMKQQGENHQSVALIRRNQGLIHKL